jgi:hypothetical protein
LIAAQKTKPTTVWQWVRLKLKTVDYARMPEQTRARQQHMPAQQAFL